ncbi:hypothetical protein TNCV_4951911 [Trichonephila clavipes]|nr:hypothetical protein TNCV_4951911 [Trichonephila clavipes]
MHNHKRKSKEKKEKRQRRWWTPTDFRFMERRTFDNIVFRISPAAAHCYNRRCLRGTPRISFAPRRNNPDFLKLTLHGQSIVHHMLHPDSEQKY